VTFGVACQWTSSYFASTMPPSPAALALQAVKNFRQKEIRAPTIQALTPYRAPIPKPPPSSTVKISGSTDIPAQSKAHGQPNPFLPRYNTQTGRWAPPKYSLRQQAELIKKAKTSNTLHLLPAGPKLTASTIQRHIRDSPPPPKILNGLAWAQKDAVIWEGQPKPQAPGADIGYTLYAGKKRMFKGHKRERTRAKKEVRTSILLSDMKKRIIRYKGVSPGFKTCLTSPICADDSLFSSITEGGRTHSNLQSIPRRPNYPSNRNICCSSHATFATICLYALQSRFHPF
jgi:large subunit ribosomal protein L25